MRYNNSQTIMESLKKLSIKKYIDTITKKLHEEMFKCMKKKISEDKYNIVINIENY